MIKKVLNKVCYIIESKGKIYLISEYKRSVTKYKRSKDWLAEVK